jgi:predicted nucleic-acid-binding protein
MKQLIDETVILRYLLDDDKRRSKQAAEIIATGQAYTYPEIIARVAVTLRDTYRVPRSQIGFTLVELLEDVYVVDEDVVRYAARLFGSSMLDFVDCLLIAHNTVRGAQVVSFDKPLVKRMLKL